MELLASQSFKQRKSKSLLSFSFEGSGSWPEWYRFLTWDKQQLIKIGNICETCGFFFEHINEDKKPRYPLSDVRPELQDGLTDINYGIKAFSRLVPKGNYMAMHMQLEPKSVRDGQVSNYFKDEYATTWNDFSSPSNDDYYRCESLAIAPKEKVFEFVIPFQTRESLNEERVEFYKQLLSQGQRPTAIAIGVLDVNVSEEYHEEPQSLSTHWSFANYVLDGHHKLEAAAQTGTPISMLTFLSFDHSWKYVGELVHFYESGKKPHSKYWKPKTDQPINRPSGRLWPNIFAK